MEEHIDLRRTIRLGLIGGTVTLSVASIGIATLFSERPLVAQVITMGQVLIYAPAFLIAYMLVRDLPREKSAKSLVIGLLSGLVGGLPMVILIVLASTFNLRQFLPNVSPALIETLTFGRGASLGSVLFVLSNGLVGLATAGLQLIPPRYRTPIQNGVIWTLTVGLFSEILRNRLRDFFGLAFAKLIFAGEALRPTVAAALFVLIFGVSIYLSTRPQTLSRRFQHLDETNRRRATLGLTALLIVFLLILPQLLGTYLSEVINNVGIFILMGLGLNIVVGFAGLLDLGYVAFFAIGAYTMAVLTSEGPLGIFGLSFWAALPICVGMAALAGIVLGIPVLRMRGDYLAIVTLGFGEIIRILALSDLLKPFIGGAQGVLKIPKPSFFGTALIQPGQFYYIILGGCLLAWFVSYRLSESRLGRQWMALREDEDVAEAMGIRLVTTKLLAFGIGAAFSGLAGAFFASKLTSIFPHSFKLEISINVLCLIIIGGMGSLPGVVVGALILVGLPELLREFAEYRLLMYGALLIVMMLAKPEGFWPSAVRRRELHAEDEEPIPIEAVAEGAGD